MSADKKKLPRKRTLTGGVSEVATIVRGPAILLAAVDKAAELEGCSNSEWWRRAARLRLGWREVLEMPEGPR